MPIISEIALSGTDNAFFNITGAFLGTIMILGMINYILFTPAPLKPKDLVTLIPGDQLGPFTYNGFTDSGGGLSGPLVHSIHLGNYILTFYDSDLPQNFTVGGFRFMVWKVDSTLGIVQIQSPPKQLSKMTVWEALSRMGEAK